MPTIYPVILSGGSGTRLWPLSREHYPKQLLALAGEQTMLQQTAKRLDGMTDVAAPVLVCNEEHRFLVAEQLRQIDKSPATIILEPAGRNTAPALTLAALFLVEKDPNAVMLVMPADHVIQDVPAFQAAVTTAAASASTGYLATFGIVPNKPETGYGYIRQGQPLAGHNRVRQVASFVEKPDAATAAQYLASGDYLWNSGMFLLRARTWLDELNRTRPDILRACEAAYRQGRQDGEFYRVNSDAFQASPSDSIDYAVMEKTDHAVVIPLDAGWSDIGAWSAIWETSSRDVLGNVIQGDVYAHDTRNALLISKHRLIATVGLDDVIVVETPDAVLIAHKNRAQDVKEIVNRLKQERRSEHLMHRRVYRPWGSYEGIDAGERFQVKRLIINPGAAISLQLHHHRAEHWVVVKGAARVTRGEDVVLLGENQSIYIPLGMKHRLENPGNIPLEIIEVQSGSYLGEDDIVRFEDRYNRPVG
ncbi:MAG: mannose-1-phosphate guanylyltransferase/mannose-6-phosphate isomerase [Nitrospira sp.]|nr:mannose-1-phosphate guanylyltransferase/mannose-6-phosphate isomerase [Nitrospira sp.]